jgi:hypothetical protein
MKKMKCVVLLKRFGGILRIAPQKTRNFPRGVSVERRNSNNTNQEKVEYQKTTSSKISHQPLNRKKNSNKSSHPPPLQKPDPRNPFIRIIPQIETSALYLPRIQSQFYAPTTAPKHINDPQSNKRC